MEVKSTKVWGAEMYIIVDLVIFNIPKRAKPELLFESSIKTTSGLIIKIKYQSKNASFFCSYFMYLLSFY
ncbi:MAG: hypothetical protein ACKO96_15530, partial [Flammeovirgaceae bacterium]